MLCHAVYHGKEELGALHGRGASGAARWDGGEIWGLDLIFVRESRYYLTCQEIHPEYYTLEAGIV